MKRFLLFLYSTPNLWGVTLALLGLAAFLLGFIRDYWFFIVVGLYGVGYLVAPKSRAEDLKVRRELSVAEVEAELNQLVRKVRRHVSKPVLEKVVSIKNSIVEVLPRLLDINAGVNKNIYIIRQTALDYLPETLENYLALPRTYRHVHPLKNGKTAQQVLLEQLELLDTQMKEIVLDFNKEDTDKLLAHGKFLEEVFKESELFV